MKITSYNHHAKAPSFPRSLSPQTKTTGSIEPSLLSHQSFRAFFCERVGAENVEPAPSCSHHTLQTFSGELIIGCPALHEKARPNSGIFTTTPLMRYSAGECGSVMARTRRSSSR